MPSYGAASLLWQQKHVPIVYHLTFLASIFVIFKYLYNTTFIKCAMLVHAAGKQESVLATALAQRRSGIDRRQGRMEECVPMAATTGYAAAWRLICGGAW
jgi:hypothetical protein